MYFYGFAARNTMFLRKHQMKLHTKSICRRICLHGYTFAMIVGVAVAHLEPLAVFGVYAVMVLGTATMNAVLAAILTPVLRAVLKR